MEYLVNENMLEQFRQELANEEKSKVTIEKYVHDVSAFFFYLGEKAVVTKETVIAYKEYLVEHYALRSVNSMLAALNCFFKKVGWYDCIVKSLKIQKEAFRMPEKELTKEEYYKLLETAEKRGNLRLNLLMQTICGTGIRISELKYLTVEAVKKGRMQVRCKGKNRVVLLPVKLCGKLKQYIRENDIKSGSVFITRSGKPMDRSNICKEMKSLCEEAGISREKVFPHNLRHLFACTYYQLKKDISHLADLLGHSNINTTRIYTLTTGEEEVKQMEVMGLVV